MQKVIMLSSTKKGFTIIELLIVVAIIAILTAIVLVNVTMYLNRGKDSSIQGDLNTILTNATVFYDAHGTYSGFYGGGAGDVTIAPGDPNGFCIGDPGIVVPCKTITGTVSNGYALTIACATSAGGVNGCNAAGVAKWCAQITLKNGGNTFCVDYTGNKLNKVGGICNSNLPTGGTCR